MVGRFAFGSRWKIDLPKPAEDWLPEVLTKMPAEDAHTLVTRDHVLAVYRFAVIARERERLAADEAVAAGLARAPFEHIYGVGTAR